LAVGVSERRTLLPVARRIRDLPWGAQPLVDREDRLEAGGRDKRQSKNAGFEVHITKPIDIDESAMLLGKRIPRLGLPGEQSGAPLNFASCILSRTNELPTSASMLNITVYRVAIFD
jgi:hypothetical protein